jgi:membrane dipeptidase
MTQGQLAWYHAMEEAGEMVQIRDHAGLERHLELWASYESSSSSSSSSSRSGDGTEETARGTNEDGDEEKEKEDRRLPIGYILSLEGADSLITLRHLERAVTDGLRAIGPAHYGPGVYANGTDASGGFNERGRELLREAGRLGLILDVTHLCDECFWEALDLFDGPMWASHQNCRALVPDMRQFSDEQLKALIARGAVIGAAFDAWMLVPGWVRGKTTPQSSGVRLAHVADHLDHICQLAGNAHHAGLGSDLDGCFGIEQTPQDLDTIADLTKLRPLLAARGYSAEDIENICWRNFVTFLRTAWK